MLGNRIPLNDQVSAELYNLLEDYVTAFEVYSKRDGDVKAKLDALSKDFFDDANRILQSDNNNTQHVVTIAEKCCVLDNVLLVLPQSNGIDKEEKMMFLSSLIIHLREQLYHCVINTETSYKVNADDLLYYFKTMDKFSGIEKLANSYLSDFNVVLDYLSILIDKDQVSAKQVSEIIFALGNISYQQIIVYRIFNNTNPGLATFRTESNLKMIADVLNEVVLDKLEIENQYRAFIGISRLIANMQYHYIMNHLHVSFMQQIIKNLLPYTDEQCKLIGLYVNANELFDAFNRYFICMQFTSEEIQKQIDRSLQAINFIDLLELIEKSFAGISKDNYPLFCANVLSMLKYYLSFENTLNQILSTPENSNKLADIIFLLSCVGADTKSIQEIVSMFDVNELKEKLHNSQPVYAPSYVKNHLTMLLFATKNTTSSDDKSVVNNLMTAWEKPENNPLNY